MMRTHRCFRGIKGKALSMPQQVQQSSTAANGGAVGTPSCTGPKGSTNGTAMAPAVTDDAAGSQPTDGWEIVPGALDHAPLSHL